MLKLTRYSLIDSIIQKHQLVIIIIIIILPILRTKVESCRTVYVYIKKSICLSILNQFGPFPSFEVLFGLGLTEMVGKGVKMSMLLGAGVEVIVEL